MGDIVLLDEQTINKIAAGEVVDRPASIVKELVENSIDAKATAISIEIYKGGVSYIKIIDNGTGFKSDDIDLAFERHATSKIRKEEDLSRITSMGFRGEALASVAAISKITLTTKNINESIGTRVRVEAGNIIEKQEIPAIDGTQIEIRDVFYNVPARFKFLKKDYTEAGYIEDVVTRIALSNPYISFRYINNGKTIIQTSGTGNLHDTIYDIFGKEIYNTVVPIEYEMSDMIVTGMIGLPSISRSTRMHQYTFINNRYIKDKTIATAIDKACEQKFAINKHPFIVCNLKMNPAFIDVNVHPAKLEVKFSDEAKVFDVIYHAVRSALEKNNKETSPFSIVKKEQKIEQISKDLVNNGVIQREEKKFDFESATKKLYNKPSVQVNTNSLIESLNGKIGDINTEVLEEKVVDNNVVESVENNHKILNKNEQVEQIETPQFNVESYEESSMLQNEKEPILYKYIGNVFDTYIIIQIEDKMYIIDQHAAHERLLYEQIKEAYYSKDRQSQLLLIPILVKLSEKEMDTVLNNKEMFEKSGFMLEEFGDDTIKISGVPNIGYDIDYKSMFIDTIEELLGANKTEKSEKEFRFLATLACKAAVKGKMKLDTKEQISLIDQMVKLDNPFTCPHGRPTAYPISKYEIERKFLRK